MRRLIDLSIFLVLASLAIVPFDAVASFFCTLTEIKAVGTDAIMGPLTPDMREVIRKHPIWNRYEVQEDGRDVSIEFTFADSPLGPGEIKSGGMGESIQAHFIAVTLREIFPEAHLYSGPSDSRNHIKMFVTDSAEGGRGHNDAEYWRTLYGTDNYLDMPILKMANGRAVKIPKAELRRQMGIPADAVVVHSYNAHLGARSIPETAALRSVLPAEKLILFTTSALGPNFVSPTRILSYRRTSSPDFKIQLITEFDPTTLSGPGPHLIENNMTGIVPLISRVSDLVVVGGPRNIFEGLIAETPTIFERYDGGGAPLYSAETFRQMARLALASGGAREFSSTETFKQALKDFRDGKLQQITPPHSIKIDGKTAFEVYLDELMKLLDRNLEVKSTLHNQAAP